MADAWTRLPTAALLLMGTLSDLAYGAGHKPGGTCVSLPCFLRLFIFWNDMRVFGPMLLSGIE
jgi:hypothetical protein